MSIFLNFWTHRHTDTEMDTELDNSSLYRFFRFYLLSISRTTMQVFAFKKYSEIISYFSNEWINRVFLEQLPTFDNSVSSQINFGISQCSWAIPKKDLPMYSLTKIYLDLDKLCPKIWVLDLFEMPHFYYCSIKGKLVKNPHFYILRLFHLITNLAESYNRT